MEGNVQDIKAALEQGAELECRNASSVGRTPLMVASAWGKILAVDYLLLCGAEINSSDSRGLSPLMLAAYFGNPGTVKLLLERGADYYTRGIFSWRPALYYAMYNQHSQVETILEEWEKTLDKEQKAKAKAASKTNEARMRRFPSRFFPKPNKH